MEMLKGRMKKVTIVGLGLMGGSLGLALRRAGLAREVCGYARRQETRDEALRLGVVDTVATSPGDAVRGADMVVFCVPILTIGLLAKECRAELAEGCVVTDVGSTKAELVKELAGIYRDLPVDFVGSHPIAGSEATGIAVAREDLYRDAVVVVTPDAESNPAAVQRVVDFWQALQSRVAIMDPVAHDRVIARTSHLPHLIAAILVGTVLREDEGSVGDFCGNGFRDATRIAAGSEEIWHDIVKSNQALLSAELAQFRDRLEQVRGMLEEGDFETLRRSLAECRGLRADWEKSAPRKRPDNPGDAA